MEKRKSASLPQQQKQQQQQENIRADKAKANLKNSEKKMTKIDRSNNSVNFKPSIKKVIQPSSPNPTPSPSQKR